MRMHSNSSSVGRGRGVTLPAWMTKSPSMMIGAADQESLAPASIPELGSIHLGIIRSSNPKHGAFVQIPHFKKDVS